MDRALRTLASDRSAQVSFRAAGPQVHRGDDAGEDPRRAVLAPADQKRESSEEGEQQRDGVRVEIIGCLKLPNFESIFEHDQDTAETEKTFSERIQIRMRFKSL